MGNTIKIGVFSYENIQDKLKLDTYFAIKYKVFVEELGFHSIQYDSDKKTVKKDKYDDRAVFVLAEKADATVVGVLRVLIIDGEFPHKALFKAHLETLPFEKNTQVLATINALAVLPSYREEKYFSDALDMKSTIGKLLVYSAMDWLKGHKVRYLILTTSYPLAQKFFVPMGFYMIDSPFAYDNAPYPVVNMAIILNSVDKEATQIRDYFIQKHKIIKNKNILHAK